MVAAAGTARLMATLLVIHHTTSPAMQAMFEAVLAGATTDEVEGVEVVVRPALTAGAADALAADGYLLGTPIGIQLLQGLKARTETLTSSRLRRRHSPHVALRNLGLARVGLVW
jgi:hypothetical protein